MVVHQALQQKSRFQYASRLRDLKAAKSWGIKSPYEFDSLSVADRAEIIAEYEATWRINAIQAWDDAEEAKRKHGN